MRLSGLVVAGYSKSASVMGVLSSPPRRDALASEQTTRGLRGMRACAIHSRMDCPTSEMEGAQNSTTPGPPLSHSSVRRSDMSVFPVPHAIMALHRSCSPNSERIPSMAFLWCGKGS